QLLLDPVIARNRGPSFGRQLFCPKGFSSTRHPNKGQSQRRGRFALHESSISTITRAVRAEQASGLSSDDRVSKDESKELPPIPKSLVRQTTTLSGHLRPATLRHPPLQDCHQGARRHFSHLKNGHLLRFAFVAVGNAEEVSALPPFHESHRDCRQHAEMSRHFLRVLVGINRLKRNEKFASRALKFQSGLR